MRATQRLAEENREQQDLIHTLLHRVDNLEASLQTLSEQRRQQLQQEKQRRGFFGGFLGPRAVA